MIIRFTLHNRIIQVAVLGLIAICLGLLVSTILKEFVIGTLNDKRLSIAPNLLSAAAQFYPDSARIHARLAQAEMSQETADLEQTKRQALAAIENSPSDYRNYLLLASIEERLGERGEAEQSLDDALQFAPNYSEVHWRLANLQMREGKLDQALAHFQIAIESNPSLAYPAIDLIWNFTNGANISALRQIVKNSPREQISLARFLINRERIAEGYEILSTVDGKTALAFWETSPLINELIEKNHARLARDLWINFREPLESPERNHLIWNGDFENENLEGYNQFEWQLCHNNFARISIDDHESHSGANALLIDFLGRSTTKLDSEIRQRVAVRAGATYQLEFFVKTQNFHAPEGPRVAISDQSGKWIVYASPIASGSDDWQRVILVFTAPKGSLTGETTLFISVKRQPKAAYEDPTRGRIWLDDFALRERDEK